MASQEDFLSFHLNADFVKQYRKKPPAWGFQIGAGNSLGELTYLTKYSRRKDDGTKERWYETCERVINGMYSILKDWCDEKRTPWNENRAQRSAQEAYERMFCFKWTPPGRGLWVMGTEFVHGRRNSAPLQNCFRGTEEIVTREYGPVPLQDHVDEVLTVAVDGAERWAKAEIHAFGEQQVQRVTFAPAAYRDAKNCYVAARSNHRVDVVVTPTHRWVLSDGGVTTDLQVGDVVPAHHGYSVDIGPEWAAGLRHGLIFGDGTAGYQYANGEREYHIRLCGAKAQQYEGLAQFERTSYPPSYNGDPWCRVRTRTDLKDFPEEGTSVDYLSGFLTGWIAADGTDAPSPETVVLASQHPKALEWLRRHAASAGRVFRGWNIDPAAETNFGPRKNPMYRYTLTQRKNVHWKVVAIEPLSEPEPVFCATVPGPEAFTLASGIYTGNCAFISTEKLTSRSRAEAVLPFIRLMEMSMLGVGVGFDTLGAGKITIHEPDPEVFYTYQIEDSREGWYESLGRLLESYFFKGSTYVEFDYSLIRPAGEPIRGFGGVAAGPSPLRDLHDNVRSLFHGRAGSSISSSDIVDLMNLIGKCVVAGNVRRSAEIALGESDDKAFLDLKNYDVNPDRMGPNGWGNVSNNSVFAQVGDNYDHLVPRIVANGEPGLLYLDLCRRYGRLVDPPNDKDYRAAGTNPCSEQTLESFECCTLVETFPINCEDIADFERTLKYAYLYAKAVTLLPTHWPETNEVMQRNHRIGCSVSGQAQFAEMYGWTELRTWLNAGYEAVQARDRQYSEWLGVRESIKTTSVKPSGTVSLLAGVTPGVHWPTADTYIRRMRLAVNDPLLPIIQEAGYVTEPDFMDPKHTVVVELPTRGPGVRTGAEVSVWEKAALAVLHQRYWCDNQVSVTLTFQPESEADQIGAVLRAFEGQLKSVSFLPIADGSYRQMPYERISDDRFDDLTAEVSKMDWDKLYGGAANDAEGERFCTNDKCELPVG